jgi:O-succinylbenzoate synthase
VVNIKMARVGGLTASRDIQALCADHAIPCWVGGMLESAIGGAICAELATLPNFTYPGDIFPSSYFYRNDIGKPELVLSGRAEVVTSTVPGIAQEPDADLLKRWTVEHASFRTPTGWPAAIGFTPERSSGSSPGGGCDAAPGHTAAAPRGLDI